MIEKGTIMESEAEPSSKELLKIYDTALAEKLMQKLLPLPTGDLARDRFARSMVLAECWGI